MPDVNLAFCRRLLSNTLVEVKEFEPKARAGDMAAIRLSDHWIAQLPLRSWYAEPPQQFLWSGRADNAFHAKAQGWAAWLDKKRREKL